MNKLSDSELKAEATRLLDKYSPPADALPGEDRFTYEERKRHEALTRMSKQPQATVPVHVWGHKS